MHQLIVIGNGFDLSCGLKSRFSQFHDSRFFDSGGYPQTPPDCNFWDLFLEDLRDGDPNWCDVEFQISTLVSKLEDFANGRSQGGDSSPGPGDGSDFLVPFKSYLMQYTNVYEYVERKWLRSGNFSLDDVQNLLLRDLHSYEFNFSEYLHGLLRNGGEDRFRTAAEIRMKLLCNDLSDIIEDGTQTTVLSFNYTDPLDRRVMNKLGIDQSLNVHGGLGGDVIIGIDGKITGGIALPFTKTYRLLSMKPIRYRQIVRPATSGQATRLIKIFGHSLAEADYSYFQSLFDAVDVYEGDTVLAFYYSKHGSGTEQDDACNAVARLLATYGETLDNKDHGQNLMHKLLLEGRLMVRELPS